MGHPIWYCSTLLLRFLIFKSVTKLERGTKSFFYAIFPVFIIKSNIDLLFVYDLCKNFLWIVVGWRIAGNSNCFRPALKMCNDINVHSFHRDTHKFYINIVQVYIHMHVMMPMPKHHTRGHMVHADDRKFHICGLIGQPMWLQTNQNKPSYGSF